MLGEAARDALLHRRHEHMERLIKRGCGAGGAPLKGRLARRLGEGMEAAASHWAYRIHRATAVGGEQPTRAIAEGSGEVLAQASAHLGEVVWGRRALQVVGNAEHLQG